MNDDLDLLKQLQPPHAEPSARHRAVDAALRAFDDEKENRHSVRSTTQGFALPGRLIAGVTELWSMTMNWKPGFSTQTATAALAVFLVLPAAGYVALRSFEDGTIGGIAQAPKEKAVQDRGEVLDTGGQLIAEAKKDALAKPVAEEKAEVDTTVASDDVDEQQLALAPLQEAEASGQTRALSAKLRKAPVQTYAARQMAGGAVASPVARPDARVERESRDRIESVVTNPVKRAIDDPVSTFSIDVDTASYALVRRSLRDGALPDPQSVRVEEMINYFPYDWAKPDTAGMPFKPTVTVTPTPWNADTLLMHVAIKGYEAASETKPKSNLVFLVDTSGSMQDADKLPLVKSSLRLLLDRMGPDDTISLVSYAGEAGVVLEPTKAADKAKILQAIEKLGAGGSTAGQAGLAEAYALAERSFIKDGVNRILLATDGDFNVGPSDDASLKRMVEDKRKSGVFLSVLGFGQGNYNDQLMQVLAQNGNGVAAYIDTLAEAEKTLVQEASANLFTIARDVKIQVEFNPSQVSEYRLIGYETRALKREDFNNDRVDAGDIGAGHSVTAIYELTPVGSKAQSVDALRYGTEKAEAAPAATGSDELAFVKLRFKKPGSDTSELVTLPVAKTMQTAFESAPVDVRFSVAAAAFGQKLRDTDAMANYGYDQIAQIAQAARGNDPFGYRAEFLTLVRLAKGLAGGR